MQNISCHKKRLTVTGADSHSSHAAGQAAGCEGPIERHRLVFRQTLGQLVQMCKQREVDHREGDVPAQQENQFPSLTVETFDKKKKVPPQNYLSNVAPSPWYRALTPLVLSSSLVI